MPAKRSTRQRDAIRSAIVTAKRPLSPQEVLEAARATVKALGLATVYRTINMMVEEGELHVIHLPGDSARYESAHRDHHHHFQCDDCRRVYDVLGCPGDLRRLAPRGFSVERHDVTLYGRCSACAKAGAKARQRGSPANHA
jgi:Fur family ferric uptake transcriptional regulator